MSERSRFFAGLGFRQAKRIIVLLIGGSVLLVGLAMLILPGPGIVVVPLGLAILALEFAWARRWLRRLKDVSNRAREKLLNRNSANEDQPNDRPDAGM